MQCPWKQFHKHFFASSSSLPPFSAGLGEKMLPQKPPLCCFPGKPSSPRLVSWIEGLCGELCNQQPRRDLKWSLAAEHLPRGGKRSQQSSLGRRLERDIFTARCCLLGHAGEKCNNPHHCSIGVMGWSPGLGEEEQWDRQKKAVAPR